MIPHSWDNCSKYSHIFAFYIRMRLFLCHEIVLPEIWKSEFRYSGIAYFVLDDLSISVGILVKTLPHLRCVAVFTNVWIFRLGCPCCPVIRKPIAKYIEYKKSHQCKTSWRPAKRLWAWHWFYFFSRVIKSIKGNFRVRNVGFRYARIMVSWRKNIQLCRMSPLWPNIE